MYKINILAHTFEKSRGVCYQTQLDTETQINSNPVSYFPYTDYIFLLIFIFSLTCDIFFPYIWDLSHQQIQAYIFSS